MAKQAQRKLPTRSETHALQPQPQRIARVVHGQQVSVKVYPPASDPAWADWFRSKLREPLADFGIGERSLD